jgi:hypothetical protein
MDQFKLGIGFVAGIIGVVGAGYKRLFDEDTGAGIVGFAFTILLGLVANAVSYGKWPILVRLAITLILVFVGTYGLFVIPEFVPAGLRILYSMCFFASIAAVFDLFYWTRYPQQGV